MKSNQQDIDQTGNDGISSNDIIQCGIIRSIPHGIIMIYHFKHVAIYVQQMRGNRYLNLQRIKGIQPQKKRSESEKWLF